jgi:hypothetical protein
MKTEKININNDIKCHAIDGLYDLMNCDDIKRDEIHFHLFNTDYFIIGRYQATKFLETVGTFQAIELIKNYENDHFGHVSTDFSEPETVANMYAYIVGEELLQALDLWSYPDILTNKDLKKLIKAIQNL